MTLRERFAALFHEAARAGFGDVHRLWSLTPAEIADELQAFAARERTRWERADAQAWLTGRYVALGLGAPSRYPKRPEGLRKRRGVMTEEEMKAELLK